MSEQRDRPITSFRGDNGFLSNFHPAIIKHSVNGNEMTFPTAEHAYQAAKTFDQTARAQIAMCSSPAGAKRIGQKLSLRHDWEKVKLDVMLDILARKFATDEHLSRKLLATGDRELIEMNSWGDTFWGVSGGEGRNMLGRLLMRVRAGLRTLEERKQTAQ